MDTSRTIPPKFHLRWDKKNAWVGIVVLILLLVAGLTWYFVFRKEAPSASTVPQYSGQQLIDEVSKRYGTNDFVGAIKLIEGQKSVNDQDTQLLLAGAYYNAGNPRKSLDIYERLEQEKPLTETYTATAADAAEQAKEYAKAIDLYKKAKQRADPGMTDQIAVYDYKIAELEKKL